MGLCTCDKWGKWVWRGESIVGMGRVLCIRRCENERERRCGVVGVDVRALGVDVRVDVRVRVCVSGLRE